METNYIYKITNKVNGKVYIGKTNDPERRWNEHKRLSKTSPNLIHLALNKYGINNFDFEVIEECGANWEEREIFYINKYNSKKPNGYNMTDGGENGPAMTGFENINSVITPETLRLITSDIKSGTMKQSELAIKYSVSKATIERITYGTVYKLEGEVYPLRTTRLIQDEVEQIIYMLYNSDLSFKKIGQYFNRDANLISEINLGNIYKQSNTIYPIKEGKICRNTYLNILMELENGLGPVVIDKKVGVAKDTVVLIRKNRNYRYNY